MGFSHILHLRRLFYPNPRFHKAIFFNQWVIKPFSSNIPTSDGNSPKPPSLSARMSFVFDQIDAIEKERSQKDETLQRIRAWRESKKEKQPAIEREETVKDADEVAVSGFKEKGLLDKGVELAHPWPEWIELMERLIQQNYFDCRRKDEGKLILDSGFDDGGGGGGVMEEVVEEGFDFTRDWKTVQTAALNFGKDRFDILRSLSRQDIQILVGYGCPSADKKVVFSAKLLRKHVHLDEGDVCSSCSLRSSCERAYLITNKEDEARTIDIMRVLLTYGFDPVNGSVVNDSLLKKKSVKTVVRKLLHEVVKLSAIPIDPNLPPPIIKRPPPKVKQTPPPPKKRVGRDDVEMKKGDWLCPKCDFMNFAKNTVCLQCDAKRPKRQLLPGEWECPECQFLNYRRNMACFHCECKRPLEEISENQMQGSRTRSDRFPSRQEVTDAWNFDFDENESDGADVAAFEYADSRKLDDEFPKARQRDEESATGFENEPRRPIRPQEREHSSFGHKKPGVGFDDFDDEEDDDVSSYELDTTQNHSRLSKSSTVNFSDLEVDSESEDTEAANDNWNARRPISSSSQRNVKPTRRRKASVSEDDDIDFNSDEDLPVHPNWKSSHVANSGPKSRGRMGAKFGSDEDSDLSSGADDLSEDDFPPRHKGGKNTRGNHKVKDDLFDRSRGNRTTRDSRPRNSAKGFDFSEGSGPRTRSKSGFSGERRGGHNEGKSHDFRSRRGGHNEGKSHDFRSPRRENLGNERFNKSRNSSGADSYLDHERFSRPRVNVR